MAPSLLLLLLKMFKVMNISKAVGIKRDVKSHIFSPSSVCLSVAASSLNLLTTEYSGEQKEASKEIYWSADMKTSYLKQSASSESAQARLFFSSICIQSSAELSQSFTDVTFFSSSENWSDQVSTSHHNHLNISFLCFFSLQLFRIVR